VLAIQIFDQKKFKKKDQGFLGVVNVRVGNVFPSLEDGGDGMRGAANPAASLLFVSHYSCLTNVLQKCLLET
jgi:hypothetical protein